MKLRQASTLAEYDRRTQARARRGFVCAPLGELHSAGDLDDLSSSVHSRELDGRKQGAAT